MLVAIAPPKSLSQHHCQGATDQALSKAKGRHLGTLQPPACPRAGAQTRQGADTASGCVPQAPKGREGSCTHLFTASALYVQFSAGGHTFPCCTVYSTSWFQKHSILKGILLKALVRGLYIFP